MAGNLLVRFVPSFIMILMVCTVNIYSAVYYVSLSGNNSNTGTMTSPFKTIQKAADVMNGGDTTYVRAGIYREFIQPAKGGTDEAHRIVYKAYPGELPSVRGSERITGWVQQGSGNVWKADIADAVFGSFNPFTTNINSTQNWMDASSRVWHRGDVYIDGTPIKERLTQQSVSDTINSWYTSHAGTTTSIWANFNGANPNTSLTEVHVREMAFYPTIKGLKYITIDGFEMKQVATDWCDYKDRTTAAIGARWGAYWIIQNCRISDAKTVGITIGSIADSESPTRNINTLGHHIIRNCIIERCGENGIYASGGGGASSIIEGNLIQDINNKREVRGQESACIKMHLTIDVTIKNNIFRRLFTHRPSGTSVGSSREDGGSFPGIWLDWGGMNSRITGNVFYDIDRYHIYLEQNHGPILVDNNVFINENEKLWSRAVVNVHNLFFRSGIVYQQEDSRQSEWYSPHSFTQTGSPAVPTPADLKFFNNMYFNFNGLPATLISIPIATVRCAWDYNLFYKKNACGTHPAEGTHSITDASFDPVFSYQNLTNGIVISFNMNTKPKDIACPLITSDYFGVFQGVNMRFENSDASSISINRDIMGNTRSSTSPSAGPFENLNNGANTFTITAGPDKTAGQIEYARPDINIAPMAKASDAGLNDRYAVEMYCNSSYQMSSGSYATFTWGYAQAMDMVRLHTTGSVPASYDVEVSTDGLSNWTSVATGVTSWTAVEYSNIWANQPHRSSTVKFNQAVGKKGLRIKYAGSGSIDEVEIFNNGGGLGGNTPTLIPKQSSVHTLNLLKNDQVSVYDMKGRLIARNVPTSSMGASVLRKNALHGQGGYIVVRETENRKTVEKMIVSQ